MSRNQSITGRLRIGAAVTAAALVAAAISACGGSSSPSSTSSSPKGSTKGETINLMAWSGEVPQDLISAFEKQTGIKVTNTAVTSNEEMIAKLSAGGSGYNLIEPSQYAVQELQQQKLIEPLDKSQLTGMDNLVSTFKHAAYDPGNKYSIPWTWGGTGLLYNSKCTGDIDSWSVLWNPKYKGKLYMLDNELSAYIPALQYTGSPATSKSQAQIEKATQALVKQKPLLAGYNSDNYAQLVASGQACAAEAYNGGATTTAVNSDPANVHFILPKEGGTLWIDGFAIPKGATDLPAVYKFLNYILQPKVAAHAATEAGESTANQAGYKYVSKKLLDNPAMYIPQSELTHAQFILNPGNALKYFNAGWLQVRAG